MIALRVTGERVVSSDESMFLLFTRGSFALTVCETLGLLDLFSLFLFLMYHVNCRETSSSTNKNYFMKREIRAKDKALKTAYVSHDGHFPCSDSVATLVKGQLVCLRPVGILNNAKFNLDYLFQLFARPH